PVAADMVVVGMRVEYDNGPRSEARDDSLDAADAHASVEKKRLLRADDKIGNGFFGLMRLVNGKRSRCDLVDFKPRFVREHVLQRFVLRPGQILRPFTAFAVR